MAALSSIDEECSDLSEVLSRLDLKAEEILARIETSNRSEIECELTEVFDKESLSNLREKIFQMVREKAAKCLQLQSAGGIFGSAFVIDPHDDQQTARSFINQWEPVPRRAEHKFASDITEFLAFALGVRNTLPIKLIRGTSLDRGCVEEECSTSLEEKLVSDIENSTAPFEVDVINSAEDSETHVVTIHQQVNAIEPEDRSASTHESDSELDEDEAAHETSDPTITTIACPT